MKYFKTSQFVPDKGDAWTYYECDDGGSIVRQMTHIPETGETERIPNPIVKQLYRPEKLQPAAEEEFVGLCNKE